MGFPVIAALPLALLLQTSAASRHVDPPGTALPETPNLVDPVIQKQVDAVYPSAAKQANVRAVLSVHTIIGIDGRPTDAWIESAEVWTDPTRSGGGRLDRLSSTLGLDDAAISAARQWVFQPAMVDEKAVPVAWTIVFEFERGVAKGHLSPPVRPPLGPLTVSPDFAKGIRDTTGPGIVPPVLVERVDPKYSSEAMRKKITGEVWLRAVVLPDGTIGDVQIVKSLDRRYGLDEAAIEAAKKWTFTPATEGGTPIPFVVSMMLEFRLHY